MSLLGKFVWAGLLIGVISMVFSFVSGMFTLIGSVAFIIAGLALIGVVISKIFFNK